MDEATRLRLALEDAASESDENLEAAAGILDNLRKEMTMANTRTLHAVDIRFYADEDIGADVAFWRTNSVNHETFYNVKPCSIGRLIAFFADNSEWAKDRPYLDDCWPPTIELTFRKVDF